ncbi:hypothetical protein MTDSW087_03189 [Methylobacterium dankookense]|uniref:Uncharacterized protein n=1 Tax=Methylobacterium dankookense TaxID=560405 RepID=A0A564G0E5_9HYPH|nr:hypothetical protein IFDJLNFL_0448 [Methylobacterium dankookense]VUF13486.1 hypothetical protein MTDSW087_03189 [Methylobacterium dankookense]
MNTHVEGFTKEALGQMYADFRHPLADPET